MAQNQWTVETMIGDEWHNICADEVEPLTFRTQRDAMEALHAHVWALKTAGVTGFLDSDAAQTFRVTNGKSELIIRSIMA